MFYLQLNQVLAMMDQKDMDLQMVATSIQTCRNEMVKCSDYELSSKIYGKDKPLLIKSKDELKSFKGVPMSKGRVERAVKIVHSLKDYQKLEKGDILVIPHSDMSFESLLDPSSAVLIESGGILSHIGIQARERNLPAFTSLVNITGLEDGMNVALDAYIGEVFVMDAQ